MKKKRILITGSNGLLGQKLVSLLSSQAGIETVATARGSNRLPFVTNYTYYPLDITHEQEVSRLLDEIAPDIIIHTAAMTHVDQCEADKEGCWAQNVTAVHYLMEAAKRVNSFFVHVSTDFIFDGQAGPYDENAAPNPLSFYGWSKYAAEKIIISSGINYAIARTVLVYGIAHDMSRSNIILWVKKSLEEGKRIQVVTDQWRTPTLAEDLAIGCMLIARQQAGGIFNISGKDLLTPYEMALMTARYFDLDHSLISPVDASTFSQPGKRPPRTGFLIEKARRVLGYQPRSFAEGISILADQISSTAP